MVSADIGPTPSFEQVIEALDKRNTIFHSQPSWHFKYEATWKDLTGKSPIWPDRRDVDVSYKNDSLFLYTAYPAPPQEKNGLKREFWSVYHKGVSADRQNASVVLSGGFNPGGLQYNYLTDAVGLDIYRNLAPVTINVKGWAEAIKERPVLPESLQRENKSYAVQAQPETVAGADCFVVKEKSGDDSMWLDPKLNFAPRKREIHISARGKRPEARIIWNSSDWKEDASGLWFPRQIEVTYLDMNGTAFRLQKVRVESIDFQELPDSYFVCPIPPTSIVSDTIRKVEYTTHMGGVNPLDLAATQAKQHISLGKSPMFLLMNGIIVTSACLWMLIKHYRKSNQQDVVK